MKRLVIEWLIMFSLSLVVSAQSGRVKPVATPAPSANVLTGSNQGATNDSDVPNPPDYSESASSPPHITNSNPSPPNIEAASAKTEKKSKKRDNSDSQEVMQTDDGEVVRVETNLITIPVSVFDRNGLYIPNLQQADFKIYEDGKEQNIAYFATAEKPFTVILLLDVSPSTAYRIEEIREAATAFVDQLKMQDSVMVIGFNEKIHVLCKLTNNRNEIYRGIGKAKFGNGTSLYEAVDSSLRKRLSKIEGRKAIVLFTDGVDTTSEKADFDSTIRLAEESEAVIFPIYYNTFSGNGTNNGGSPFPVPMGRGPLSPKGTMSEDYVLGRKYLNDLANVTGGRMFRPGSTPGGLTAAFEGIAQELRSQYNIGYIPQEDGQIGQRKQIKVRVNRPNLAIRARDSYVVGTNNQTSGTN